MQATVAVAKKEGKDSEKEKGKEDKSSAPKVRRSKSKMCIGLTLCLACVVLVLVIVILAYLIMRDKVNTFTPEQMVHVSKLCEAAKAGEHGMIHNEIIDKIPKEFNTADAEFYCPGVFFDTWDISTSRDIGKKWGTEKEFYLPHPLLAK